jgi:hypothetical protein
MELRTKSQALADLAGKLAALPDSHPNHAMLTRMVRDLRYEIERDPCQAPPATTERREAFSAAEAPAGRPGARQRP